MSRSQVRLLLLHSPAPLVVGWVGGGSGGGLSGSILSKQGQFRRNSSAVSGRCQRSTGVRVVGWESHWKRCRTVCSSCRQHGQMGKGPRRIRCLKSPREEQPERSCARVGLAPISTSGAAPSITRFGLLEEIAISTALMWISLLASLMSTM